MIIKRMGWNGTIMYIKNIVLEPRRPLSILCLFIQFYIHYTFVFMNEYSINDYFRIIKGKGVNLGKMACRNPNLTEQEI